jgi:hypothetical protein
MLFLNYQWLIAEIHQIGAFIVIGQQQHFEKEFHSESGANNNSNNGAIAFTA